MQQEYEKANRATISLSVKRAAAFNLHGPTRMNTR